MNKKGSHSVTLGGDRLGSGNTNKVELHNFGRSTHDLSYIWRSTMASGTLVPFMNEIGLPGDSFDINLNCDVKTHPTIGPLFGSYKVQLDVFQCPIRLYNGKLHMNMLGIGLKMNAMKLPQIRVSANGSGIEDNSQVNPSALLSYLGIRGVGRDPGNPAVYRDFNAIPLLAYWDIFKNYYANKQEGDAWYIHNPQGSAVNSITTFRVDDTTSSHILHDQTGSIPFLCTMDGNSRAYIEMTNDYEPKMTTIFVNIAGLGTTSIYTIFKNVQWNTTDNTVECSDPFPIFQTPWTWDYYVYTGTVINDEAPILQNFHLSNIDEMRIAILTDTSSAGAFMIDELTLAPYGSPLSIGTNGRYPIESTQEGLAVKTYNSDLFNNWISTDWIEGSGGINDITSIDTTSGSFSIDTLQLARKVYDMLNRIAISGGSYDDWLSAVYTHDRTRQMENPVYMGGLIKELAFQEVVSNAAAAQGQGTQPLGTLAGKGTLTAKNKGGNIIIKVNEPCIIMGIVSLTPKIDYSQGNKWSVNLKTMDDFHKPSMDEIGFQDLITDQMAWWDTDMSSGQPVFNSAGKQPAWINYMTNVNECRGNFADANQQMFMTLNRRYEQNSSANIQDLTTYIDPRKFNNIFADTRLDAQNFWTQIAVNITARRKMSAKIMPNL